MNMTYIEQFKAELAQKLESGENSESIVTWASEKILQSYKNGSAAARKRKAPAADNGGSTEKAE